MMEPASSRNISIKQLTWWFILTSQHFLCCQLVVASLFFLAGGGRCTEEECIGGCPKLSCCTDLDSFSGQQLIMLTFEAALSERNLSVLYRLAYEKQLVKVFVKEAHCFMLDSHYRPDIRRLVWLETFRLPIVLLTATCSPPALL